MNWTRAKRSVVASHERRRLVREVAGVAEARRGRFDGGRTRRSSAPKDTFASAGSLFLAQVDLPGLGEAGPDDLRSLLTAIVRAAGHRRGWSWARSGHLTQVRGLVVAGIVLVFVGGGVFVVAVGQFG